MSVRHESKAEISQIRPHNKSVLWEEYLEHYNQEKQFKYFNSKHKKAFCKRCIMTVSAELETLEARAEFDRTGGGDWEEWKFKKAFDKVTAISGRSSNMKRHINTCPNIFPQALHRINAAIQAEAKAKDRDDSFGSSSFRGSSAVLAQSYSDNFRQLKPRASPSDDDASSSSVASPRRDLDPLMTTTESGPSPRVSLSVHSILNAESTSPNPGSRSRSVDHSADMTGARQWQLPVSFQSPPRMTVDAQMLMRLNRAHEDIDHVRKGLFGVGSSMHGGPLSYAHADASQTILEQQREIERLREKNEVLKRKFAALEERYEMEARSNPHRIRGQLSGLDTTNIEVGMDENVVMETPRASSSQRGMANLPIKASSAPTMHSPVESIQSEGKRRKIGEFSEYSG